MLFVKAWELADAKAKERIKSLMDEKDEDLKIKSMLALYNELGVNKLIEDLMTKYYNKGMGFLNKIEIEADRKQPLRNFANNIYHRDF